MYVPGNVIVAVMVLWNMSTCSAALMDMPMLHGATFLAFSANFVYGQLHTHSSRAIPQYVVIGEWHHRNEITQSNVRREEGNRASILHTWGKPRRERVDFSGLHLIWSTLNAKLSKVFKLAFWDEEDRSDTGEI